MHETITNFLEIAHNLYTALYIYIYIHNLIHSHPVLPFCTHTHTHTHILATAVLPLVKEPLEVLFVMAVGPAVVFC